MTGRNILYALLVMVFVACSDAHDTKVEDGKVATATELPSEEPAINFSNTDSAEFIYYPDPKDQKIYKHRFVKDTVLLNQLTTNLNRTSSAANECAHKMKFYLFRKGEVYKTVYLSDSCKYLAYAINGKQVYIPLDKSVSRFADSLRKKLK